MKIIKSLLSGLLVVAVSLGIALLLAEGVVRLLYKDQINLFPRYHTDAHYSEFTLRSMRPNSDFWHTSRDGSWHFHINNKGLRNTQDFAYEKPSGTVRLLALGDSHTQGYEVRQDQTYSSVMQRYLQHAGVNAQVINAGVSGFSTAEALVYLENEGYKYSPDVVVLGFFANDFQDNLKADFFRLNPDGELVVNKYEHIPGVRIQNFIYSLPLVKWLSENSYFYSMLFNATWEFFKGRLAANADEKVTEYALPTTDSVSDYDYALTAALVRRMYSFCQQHGIRLIIVDIPVIAEKGGATTSFSGGMEQAAQQNSDAVVEFMPLFADYNDVAQLHLPHGHRHISEFSHSLIGVAAAKAAQELLAEDNNAE